MGHEAGTRNEQKGGADQERMRGGGRGRDIAETGSVSTRPILVAGRVSLSEIPSVARFYQFMTLVSLFQYETARPPHRTG